MSNFSLVVNPLQFPAFGTCLFDLLLLRHKHLSELLLLDGGIG
jgi:hypothetical protein